MTSAISPARSPAEIAAAKRLVWEFFDILRDRYPEMLDTIDTYVQDQDVAGQLDDFAANFLPPAGECFLARHNDEYVGLVMLKPHGDGDGEMNRMYVNAAARGLGLGRQLGAALIEQSRALGHHTLWLDALHRHVEALPLYESLGFELYTDPAAIFADDERVIHMKMVL